MARGCLTDEIKEKYNITLKQLRLLPYFQYLLMNESRLDASKVDAEERAILQQWRDEGKITFSISEPCTCTKEFWNWMNEILWESYVPHKESEDKLDELPPVTPTQEPILDKIRAEIIEEKDFAYADFEQYKVDYLGVDAEYVEDELPQDDFRYGMERALEIIDKYKADTREVKE